jgi:hypothetical protein
MVNDNANYQAKDSPESTAKRRLQHLLSLTPSATATANQDQRLRLRAKARRAES